MTGVFERCRHPRRAVRAAVFAVLALGFGASTAHAHPHAFVDGGIDFVIGSHGDRATLDALHVTWLLDEFETLYMLSAAKVGLNNQGTLDATDNATFEAQMHTWLGNFAGSAHATTGGRKLALEAPSSVEVAIVEGRLKITFDRPLVDPVAVDGQRIDVAFYEASYFYAHSVTQPSVVRGESTPCSTRMIPFNPDAHASAIQARLQRLAREEEPENTNVGALFADRIVLQCAV
ncbi:MAG: DUF1007 family protein [Pseudomonadota bacterium]